MKIVILDGFTANPGDMSWEELGKLGDLVVHDRTAPDELLARASGAEILLTNKTVLDADAMNKLPNLKYIGVLATGTNVVDMEAATQQDVVVTNVPDYSSDSVAQAAFALLLELANQVGCHSSAVYAGDWVNSKDFCFTKTPLVELAGKNLGLVGYGHIGQKVATIGCAFGMNILVHRRTPGTEPDISYVDLDELFAASDVISLHCPLSPQTEKLVNADRIQLMKRDAFLINTGRGGLIDEDALAAALNDGRIAGAALDVLSTEPPAANNPLLRAKNCMITPHVAWATQAARTRLIDVATKNVGAFIKGQAVNQVN